MIDLILQKDFYHWLGRAINKSGVTVDKNTKYFLYLHFVCIYYSKSWALWIDKIFLRAALIAIFHSWLIHTITLRLVVTFYSNRTWEPMIKRSKALGLWTWVQDIAGLDTGLNWKFLLVIFPLYGAGSSPYYVWLISLHLSIVFEGWSE